jgi:hypothetical protein
MCVFSIVLSLSVIVPLLSIFGKAQAAGTAAPTPSEFDSSATLPKNLIPPAKLNIPANTRIEVTGWTKGVDPSLPPDTKNLSLLWNPHLLNAVIESDQQNVHAVFQWDGGRSSEAFIIKGLCFRLICLAYPQTVAVTSSGLDFWVSRQDPGEAAAGNFPCISWYHSSDFVGTASLNGNKVLVFAPGKKAAGTATPTVDTYPVGASLCLDPTTLLPAWLTDGKTIYSFTYLPAHNVQINPQGYYLKAIQSRFGHYP